MQDLEAHQELFRHSAQQFADYFTKYAVSHQKDWPELSPESANLLSAARYYYDSSDYTDLLALREALQPYLDLQGHWSDSLLLNDWAISLAQSSEDWPNVARLTHDRGDMLNQLGMYREAEQFYLSSEEIRLRLNQEEAALGDRHMRSMVVRGQGRLSEAADLCEATIKRAQQLGLSRWVAHPLYVRALIARDRGDFLLAKNSILQGLSYLSTTEEPAMVAQCHHFLGELALIQGQLADARLHLETSLKLSQDVGIVRRIAATQRLLGDLALAEKQFDEAETLYRDSLTLASQLSDRPQEARVLLSYAQMMASQNRLQESVALLQKARFLYKSIVDPSGVVVTSVLLSRELFRIGQLSQAVGSIWIALRAAWASRLVNPRILFGIIRRKMR